MRGNKLFVRSMIITAIVGLTALMIILFIGVKWYLDDQTPEGETQPPKPGIETPEVPFNSTILGVIKSIEGDTIQVFDIEKRQNVQVVIEAITRIKDAYGKSMPQEMLKVGDIVQMVYEPNKDELTEISASIQAWTKTDMKVAKLDKPSQTMKIGPNTYKYNDNTVIIDVDNNPLESRVLGEYDVLELKGIDNNIYSIKVMEQQGYLQLLNAPSNEGALEINLNRQIPMGSITGPVPIGSGTHEIVVRMQGYEPLRSKVTIKAGETLTVDLAQLKKIYTNLVIEVTNTDVLYEVKINGISYAPDEPISLASGAYDIEITANGYYEWKQHITLMDPDIYLPVQLEPIGGVTTEIPQTGNTSTNDTTANTSDVVTMNTEPVGAEVYINGTYKGLTPYTTSLELGSHTITLQKEGYETYETVIQIDNSDTQNNYLYRLIPLIP